MRYFIYSFLIFSFLMIDFDANAQKPLRELGKKLGLVRDTIYDKDYRRDFLDSLNVLGDKYNLVNPDSIYKEYYIPASFDVDGRYIAAHWTDNARKIDKTAEKFGKLISVYQFKEDGCLVVMLRTSSNRLKKLRILSRDKQLSEVQRQNIKLRIKDIKDNNKIINESLINAFSMNYTFSDVYFMYDSSLTDFKNGVRKGIFVNNNGEIDNSIELKTEIYYTCNYALVSSSKETKGLIINDLKTNKKPPFPNIAVSGSSGLNMLLQLFTDDGQYLEKKILKDTEKLEEKLSGFIDKNGQKFIKP